MTAAPTIQTLKIFSPALDRPALEALSKHTAAG
jgi:hypothetical protein